MHDYTGGADCIVVLSQFLEPDGSIGVDLKTRLTMAQVIFMERRKRGDTLPIIISGGGTADNPHPQGEAARDYLIRLGVPEILISWSNEGLNTLDEISFAVRSMRVMWKQYPMVIADLLQLIQADFAFSHYGYSIIPLEATLVEGNGLPYFLKRLVAIPLTMLDPTGESLPFRALRYSRAHLLGSRV